ncbi:MAG: hypothetical protein WB799_04680 [Candidatus Sulfotelmatobacter sp.]
MKRPKKATAEQQQAIKGVVSALEGIEFRTALNILKSVTYTYLLVWKSPEFADEYGRREEELIQSLADWEAGAGK